MTLGVPGSCAAAFIAIVLAKSYQGLGDQDRLKEEGHRSRPPRYHIQDVAPKGEGDLTLLDVRREGNVDGLALRDLNVIIFEHRPRLLMIAWTPGRMIFTTGHLHPTCLALARRPRRQHFLSRRAQAPRFSTGYPNCSSKASPTLLSGQQVQCTFASS